jgi:hypothetical protein
MSPEFIEKWEHIIEGVEKKKIPVEFIRKLVLKLKGRRQRTINVELLLDQGMDADDIEETVNQKLEEYDHELISVEFILNIEGIADIIQPEIDDILKKL